MLSIKIIKTPVHIQPAVSFLILALWGGVTWFNIYLFPSRDLWLNVSIGFFTMLLLLIADFGHALAHIFSARLAGAPMDEIRISITKMPHTLYNNNKVSPAVHRMRATGGPFFNACCLVLSLGVFYFSPIHSIAKELSTWSAAAHSMMLIMSLAPLPIVDGGSILKWTLVEKGWTESAAEVTASRIGWIIGIVSCLLGLSILAFHIWILGGILLGAGSIVLGVALGFIH
jgi:hypothetical protein